MRTESGLKGRRGESCMFLRMMVARDGVEPPTPAFSGRLNNLSDSRWPPKSLRRRERHGNRGLKSWVQKRPEKAPNLGRIERFHFRYRNYIHWRLENQT